MPPSPSTPTQNRGCCENGRPVLTDPHTGQSVCSCQYSSALLGYSRLSGLSSALFPTGTYTTGAAAQGYGVSIGAENSAFYSPLVSTYFFIASKCPVTANKMQRTSLFMDMCMRVFVCMMHLLTSFCFGLYECLSYDTYISRQKDGSTCSSIDINMATFVPL